MTFTVQNFMPLSLKARSYGVHMAISVNCEAIIKFTYSFVLSSVDFRNMISRFCKKC